MINGKTVVYTVGTFDVLHVNHIRLLEYAKALGDILIVGVNSDELCKDRGKEIINPLSDRLELIRSLKTPDLVVPRYTKDVIDIKKKLKFDILVVGDDWSGKCDYLENLGVTVVYTPYGRGVSSTVLRQKIKSAKK